MKQLLLLAPVFFFFSCVKSKDLVRPTNVTNSLAPANSLTSFVSLNLNGQDIKFNSVVKERDQAHQYFNLSAENDSIKIELKINSIHQTGNSTGFILQGNYGWKLYKKTGENVYVEYATKEQWLGLYSDRPLTDGVVSGEFYFKAKSSGSTANNSISNGKFRLVF